MDDLAYTTLGRYRLLHRIGRGGMGEVWLGEDPRLQRQVAIKVLPLRARDDKKFLARFEHEAQTAAALHHPHILPVHDYGQHQMPDNQTVTYLVMSYIAGGSIEDRLKAMARGQTMLTQGQALAYLFQVAEAIDYAHAHGIIHRDIKPANMLVREDSWLFLTDFGIARILTDNDARTETETYLGTPAYMAPEQAQGRALPASDLYSLAVIAYQLFTGRTPFQADNPYSLAFQHAFAEPVAPRVYNPALSPQCEAILLRGLAKDPAQRSRSATAFITSLSQALETHVPAVRATDTFPRSSGQNASVQPPRRVTRRRVLVGTGIGVLLIGGSTAAYAFKALGNNRSTVSTPTPVRKNAPSTSPLLIAAAFNQPVIHMAWSPTKNVLLTTSTNAANFNNGLCKLWSMPATNQSTTPTQIATHEFNNKTGLLPAWSPDGTKIALANAGGSILTGIETLLYTADLAAPVPGIPAQALLAKNYLYGLGWLSNTSLVTLEGLIDTNYTLKIWHIQHLQQPPVTVTTPFAAAIDFSDTLNLLAISPDGLTLAIGTENHGIQIGQVNVTGKRATWHALSPGLQFQGEIGMLGWSATGRFVAAAANTTIEPGPLEIWDTLHQYEVLQPALDFSALSSIPSCFAWGPPARKQLLAVAGVGGQVALWNIERTTIPPRLLPGNLKGAVTALAWSADGQWLAASYSDAAASILIWRIENS